LQEKPKNFESKKLAGFSSISLKEKEQHHYNSGAAPL
jgi:hypothetical protein